MSSDAYLKSADETRAVLSRLRGRLGVDSDFLSPKVVNEALLTILENQARIFEGLASLRSVGGPAVVERPVARVEDTSSEPSSEQGIKVKAVRPGRSRPVPELVPERDEDATRLPAAVEKALDEPAQDESPQDAVQDEPETAKDEAHQETAVPSNGTGASTATDKPSAEELAEQIREAFPKLERLSQDESVRVLRAFDNRGDPERGLEHMNTWLTGITGTPFQVRRKSRYAFLNVSRLAPEKILQREEMMKRYAGFVRRLGELTHSELEGRVWVYSCPQMDPEL